MEVSATTATTTRPNHLVSAKKKRKRNNDNLHHHHHQHDCIEFRGSTSAMTTTTTATTTTPMMQEASRSDRGDDDDDDYVSGSSCCSSNGSRGEINELLSPDLDQTDVFESETSPACHFSRSGREEEQQASMDALQPELSSSTTTLPASVTGKENFRPESTVEEARTRRRGRISKVSSMEIEDFFARAERDYREHVMKKYNFDFLNEKPMNGRYEWIRIEP